MDRYNQDAGRENNGLSQVGRQLSSLCGAFINTISVDLPNMLVRSLGQVVLSLYGLAFAL